MDGYENERGDRDPAAAFRPRRWPLVVAGGLLAAALSLFLWRSVSSRVPADSESPVAQAPQPTAAAPTPAALPPVDETDALVRSMLGRLLQSRALESWLKSGDLVRRFVSAVNAFADGEAPRESLPFLAPKGAFAVATQAGKTIIDGRTYRRHEAFMEAVSSLDPKACAAAYARLSPLLESAHAEVGRPGTTFSATLARAIARVEKVPIPDGPLQVASSKLVYQYADPALESLPDAEKQLLRLGPENARALQQKLAAVATAIGLR